MALLPFLAAGQAHRPLKGEKESIYAKNVELGLGFLERAKSEPLDAAAGAAAPGNPWPVYTQALLLSNEFVFVD